MRPSKAEVMAFLKPDPITDEEQAGIETLKPGDYEIYRERLTMILAECKEVFMKVGNSNWVLSGDLISRLHARIEHRNNRFALTDQSTNGSYVLDGAGNVRFVRHDTQVLSGSGTISFGRKPEPNQTDLVHYRLSACPASTWAPLRARRLRCLSSRKRPAIPSRRSRPRAGRRAGTACRRIPARACRTGSRRSPLRSSPAPA